MSSSSGKQPITPATVQKMKEPTHEYLCPLSANKYGIDFVEFKIREMESNRVIFHVRKDPDLPTPKPEELDDTSRFIQYDFGASFLAMKTVGTTLVFKVGERPLPNFKMIERHYFRNRLIKSFEFGFGFCIPGSTNEWEVMYDMPALSQAEKEDMVAHPFETRSDSFYFVDDQLVMHNKAEYAYTRKR